MAEYIEREVLQKKIARMIDYCQKDFTVRGLTALFQVADAIMDCPAVDVAPVVHGRWIWKHRHRGGFRKYTGQDSFGETHTITVDERFEIDEPYCSECGKWNESVFLNYCPNCGAKMDLEGV